MLKERQGFLKPVLANFHLFHCQELWHKVKYNLLSPDRVTDKEVSSCAASGYWAVNVKDLSQKDA